MSAVLMEESSLMEKIIGEYGAMIRSAVHQASGGLPCADDIISEVYFAVLLTLRKLGDGWTPPRSFIFAVIRNKVNDYLRQKYRDMNGIEEIKKRTREQSSEREEVVSRVPTLTRCEFQVFRLLGLGMTNQEVAQALHISLHTVRSHVKKIHAKCGLRDRAKVALIAHQACYRGISERSGEDTNSSSRNQEAYLRRGSHPRQPKGGRDSAGYGRFLVSFDPVGPQDLQ